MLNSRVREHVQTSLQSIAKKAKEAKQYRFCDLYRLINRVSLMDAWYDINKKSAAGVDKVTAGDYEKNLLENLINLEKRLKKKQYKTKLVKRVYIPKGKGKVRPLGIPALEDKLVQSAAAKILKLITFIIQYGTYFLTLYIYLQGMKLLLIKRTHSFLLGSQLLILQ